MANIFDKLEPIVKTTKRSAKTQKIALIEKGPHKFAGPANVKATGAAGTNKDSFYNGSHNISERQGDATPAVIDPGTSAPTDISVVIGDLGVSQTPATGAASDGVITFTSPVKTEVVVSTSDDVATASKDDVITFTLTPNAGFTVNGKATDTVTYTVL